MSKKILLLSASYKPGYMRNARCDFVSWSGCQWWPIQLGYLGAFLESKGYEVKIIDAPAYGYDMRTTGALVKRFDPDYCIVYAGDQSYDDDGAIVKALRQFNVRARLAGPFTAARLLRNGEYDPHYPPEYAPIVGCLEDGVLNWIKSDRDQDGHVIHGDHSKIDLDDIPFVSKFYRKHLNHRYYVAPSEPWPFVDILTGRGCAYGKCTYCLWPKTYKQGYTTRSMLNVMDEVDYIEHYTPFRSIMIEDDTFTEWRAKEFSDAKLKLDYTIPWSCLVRAELTYPTMRLMKRAGCLNIHVGYESGNDDTLIAVGKGLTTMQMEEFTRKANQAGLRIHGDFMIGIDSSVDGINRTIDWACGLGVHTAQFQVYQPFFESANGPQPGSPLLLRGLAVKAYRKFYSNPRNWRAVLAQIGKPRVLANSLRSVLGRGRS